MMDPFHVNIKNIFLWNGIFQNNFIGKRGTALHFCQFLSCLTLYRRDSPICLCIQRLLMCCLGWSVKELQLPTDVSLHKEKTMLKPL